MRRFILVAAFAICGCEWNGFGGTGGEGGGYDGSGDTCHQLAEVEDCNEGPALAASCASTFGPGNPDPILCDADVLPDGNCKAIAGAFACGRAVFCCGENGPAVGAP